MLFWKVWFDGDGVGDGEVAWEAGAATRRIARMEAPMAPSILSNPRRAPAGGPWGVLLKLVNLHLGAVSAAPLQPLRTGTGVGWCHQAGTATCVSSVTLLGLCYSAEVPVNAEVQAPMVAIG